MQDSLVALQGDDLPSKVGKIGWLSCTHCGVDAGFEINQKY